MMTVNEGDFPRKVIYVADTRTMINGTTFSGSAADVDESDDNLWEISPQTNDKSISQDVSVVFGTQLDTDSPLELKMVVESRIFVGLRVRMKLHTSVYNWNTGEYDSLGSQRIRTGQHDRLYEVDLSGNPADYVQPETGQVNVRLGWDPVAPNYTWTYRAVIDQYTLESRE